jgi:hypothetical protein
VNALDSITVGPLSPTTAQAVTIRSRLERIVTEKPIHRTRSHVLALVRHLIFQVYT